MTQDKKYPVNERSESDATDEAAGPQTDADAAAGAGDPWNEAAGTADDDGGADSASVTAAAGTADDAARVVDELQAG